MVLMQTTFKRQNLSPSAWAHAADDDVELGLLSPAQRADWARSPGPAAAAGAAANAAQQDLPSELWAGVFAHVEGVAARQQLQLVHSTWRDMCRTPAVFAHLYGDAAYSYVTRQAALAPKLARLLPQAHDASPLWLGPWLALAQDALRQSASPSLCDMVQATTAYAALRRTHAAAENAEAAYWEAHALADQTRHEACVELFLSLGKWTTLPGFVAWVVAQLSVPRLNDAFSQSGWATAAGVGCVAPLLPLALSATCAGLIYGIDLGAARLDQSQHARRNAVATADAPTPAFFDVIEHAWRNAGAAS